MIRTTDIGLTLSGPPPHLPLQDWPVLVLLDVVLLQVSLFPLAVPHDVSSTDPPLMEKYFTQTMDHFNFNSMGNATFRQRYLITVYGGMLSVYMRLKYPQRKWPARWLLAPPILSTAGLGDPRQFFRDVTADFQNISPDCRDAVRGAFGQLKELADKQDYSLIQEKFALCEAPSSAQDVHQLNGLLRNAFTLMAMLDYPYSTHFMGNLPANPVQACTEIDLCFESNNMTDMFPPMTFTEADRESYCTKRWGVVPRPNWLRVQFWGDALSTASNIIFSNGDLDPWANGGVRKSLSSSLVAINISKGAHHLDLRGSNDADPGSVIKARKTESQLIEEWVKMERDRLKRKTKF
ncbi:hypothetical protein WMY93_004150 [Mugilogobius chulae]|uniref:Dipeptidyl peptidase 2 n=1 Tax=Mugilogobius chulae TaxID=88201 RepID=A0AAW0PQ99_9GOBI